MKTSFLVLSFFVFCLCGTTFAQQDKLITHFMYDKMSLNPGKTGLDGGICVTSMYRNQWDKVNGAPNSVVLNVEADMTRWFPGGLGISFFHDAIGFNRQNNVMLNYAFPLEIPGAGKLGIGVGVGMMNFSMSPEWVPPTTLNDPTLPSAYSAINVDLNFGIYFKGVQDYYVGISSTHLSESSLVSDANPLNVTTYNTARHYYLMGGKTFNNIGDGAIETNAIVRTDLVKLSADVNARYIWKKKAYGGLTYRVSDAVAVMLGYNPVQNFTVGYSYDISINKLSSISRGSHEILVKYCYYLPPIPIQKSKHPRWL